MDALKTVLPTLATALASPLAGVAVAAVCELFDIETKNVDAVASFVQESLSDPDKLAELRRIEADLRKYEIENGFRFAELEIRDRESARQRESSVRDNTNRVIAYMVIIAFLAVTGGVIFAEISVDQVLAGTLIGYISAKAEQVLSYYFGSTAGSKLKTELLLKSASTSGRNKD